MNIKARAKDVVKYEAFGDAVGVIEELVSQLEKVEAERDAALACIADLEVERDRALEGVADQRRGIARRMEDIAALEVENLDLEARIAELENSEWATLVQPCETHHELPYDFEQCETHDRTFPIGGKCDHEGLSYVDYQDRQHMLQRARAVKAEARIEELEARIAEAAKLHRKYTYYDLEDSCPDTTDEHREEHHHEASDDIGEFYCDQMPTGDVCCDTCRDVNGDRMDWPCPTAVALGLNEGENE